MEGADSNWWLYDRRQYWRDLYTLWANFGWRVQLRHGSWRLKAGERNDIEEAEGNQPEFNCAAVYDTLPGLAGGNASSWVN